MGRLIDTSIFIEAERERLDLYEFISANLHEQFFMSVITVSELLHGVHRASDKYKKQRSKTIENWIEEVTIIDIDLQIARKHALIYSELKALGQLIGVHDQWIAATCLARDLTIVTANVGEFKRIPGLIVENWSTVT